MFEDYKIAVLNFYREQHEKRLLSTNLETPNRERLRRECATVFLRKNSKKDKEFVKSFFDPEEQYKDQVRSIERFNLDKFRPIVSFLTQNEEQPRNLRDDNNIKLLAWLLNFPEYENWRDDILGTDSENETSNPEGNGEDNPSQGDSEDSKDGDGNDDDKIPQEDDENSKKVVGKDDDRISKGDGKDQQDSVGDGGGENSKSVDEPTPPVSSLFKVACSFLILFVAIGSYWFWKNNADKTIRQPLASEHCMYWTGQHYEPINCNDNDQNKVKLPLNLQQLNHQQRITMPDTLTNYALGKVWYGKVNGSIDKTPQFYTDSGTNPLDTTKRLLPLTPYMLNKYVSYERHLLNMLVWIVSLFVLFSLLVTLAYKTRPRHKKEKI